MICTQRVLRIPSDPAIKKIKLGGISPGPFFSHKSSGIQTPFGHIGNGWGQLKFVSQAGRPLSWCPANH